MEAHIKAFLVSLENQPTYTESTRMAYAGDLRVFTNYLKETLHRSPILEDLNGKQVAAFLEAERQEGKRKSTLLRRRATLRRFALFLDQEGSLKKDFLEEGMSLIDETISRVSSGPPAAFLTPAQTKELWAIIETSHRPRARRDQAILSLLLETGLSVCTLIELNLSDLDLPNGRLRLTQENGVDVWSSLGESAPILERYLHEGRPELHHKPDEPALFISQLGKRISRQGVWQILRHWGRMIDQDINLSPRMVRHTAAVRMSLNGRPLNEIQTLLGHSNPLSTQALLRRLESAQA